MAVDALLALAAGLVPTFGMADRAEAADMDALGYGLLLGAGAVLVLHRRLPRATFALALALHLTYIALDYPEGADWLAPTVALSSLTWARGWRVGAPLAVAMLGLAVGGGVQGGAGLLDPEIVLIVTGLGCAVAVGEWLRTRDALLAGSQEQALMLDRTRVMLEHTREDEARQRVDAERLRISREVHDVVAHAIASINVQAGVAMHVAGRDPDRALEALSAIRGASGAALGDLRTVLGVLRADDQEDAPSHPVLADLDQVLDRARGAGVAVHQQVRGCCRTLPSAVESAAFRVVQEAVTNTIRHAAAATMWVTLTYAAERLEVEVLDDGQGVAPTPAVAVGQEGHGLRGMRERAALLGGHVEAGPSHVKAGPSHGGAGPPDRGFAVRVRLPLRDGATPTPASAAHVDAAAEAR